VLISVDRVGEDTRIERVRCPTLASGGQSPPPDQRSFGEPAGRQRLDAGANVRIGDLADGGIVQDDGRGIDGTPEEIAQSRPLVSTKLLLSRPGALSGTVCAWSTGPSLPQGVSRRHPQSPDCASAGARRHQPVVSAEAAKFPVGARIEISFGPPLPRDASAGRTRSPDR
jgi:hypothetical protein